MCYIMQLKAILLPILSTLGEGGGGGQLTLSTFSTSCFGDFSNFWSKCRKIKRRIVQKVVRNDVLDMCTKILELYDSHCSFSGLKNNFAYR